MKPLNFFGITFVAAVVMIAGTITASIPNLPTVSADPDCAKAGLEINKAGNGKGNAKQCAPLAGIDEPKEPVRNCDSKNNVKDNDGDALIGCKIRGSN